MSPLTVEAVFDRMGVATHENPYARYRLLRDHAPVYHREELRLWAPSRHTDVMAAERDWKVFTSKCDADMDRAANQCGKGSPRLGSSSVTRRHDTSRSAKPSNQQLTPVGSPDITRMVRSSGTSA